MSEAQVISLGCRLNISESEQIRANRAIGAQVLEPRNEVYRIAAQVPALHALEDEIVTVLQ